jgi:hypothetical protein
MNNNIEKDIEEIKKRMEYLKSTDQISITEKIAIVKRALKIIDESKSEKETAQ